MRTERTAQQDEHRAKVRLIADLAAETLDAGVTKTELYHELLKYRLDEYTKDGELVCGELVSAVLQSPLLEHAARRVGVETLARNIANYKASGANKTTALHELEIAGFLPGEIAQAWAAA